MLKYRKSVLIAYDVYIFDEDFNKKVYKSIYKLYSKKTKVCKEVKLIDNKIQHFNVCSFMSSVYVIGGLCNVYKCSNKCYKYDKINQKWRKIVSLNVKRFNTPCTVFQGKIVITAGNTYNDSLKSVEAYDLHENKWTYLSDMNKRRYDHSSVTIGKKLFVIGGYDKVCSEVYDSISRNFTMFNLMLPYTSSYYTIKTMSFNSKIVVFCVCSSSNPSKLYVYNVDEPNWI